MRSLFKHPIFMGGLLLRLLMLAFVMPQAALHWFVPFMEVTTSQFTLDPWSSFLATGGSEAAFPYGYVMWLIFLPLTGLCNLVGIDGYYGYGLTLLLADVILLALLKTLFNVRDILLLGAYWLSPIVLFATYWLGFNDLIPVVLLCGALYCIRHLKAPYAGAFCGAAVSAKLSMVLALPFFVIYLFRNRALRHLLPGYLQGLILTLTLFYLPFFLSTDGLHMLFRNPEMGKTYQFALHLGEGLQVYLLPLAYLLMLYMAWRAGRITFELFNVLLGIAFFLVVLLTPAAPGWFIWVLPLLIYYISQSGNTAIALVGGFTTLYIGSNFLSTPQPLLFGADLNRAVNDLRGILGEKGLNLLHTALLAFGIVLVMRIWRDAISNNDYFRLSRKPFVIGITGDSGAGKDSLVLALEDIFGAHSVVQLSGDDYHLWDRNRPMWQVMTHLNPRANDIERYAEDLLSLVDGKPIQAQRYDHATGRMSHPIQIKSNDFIIASGLHALHLPILRNCYDLKIYLDIDEGLRRHFKLERDVHQRGHSLEKVLSSIEKREADAVKFVRPQASYADLILSLRPIHPRVLEDAGYRHPLRFKLSARSRHGLNEESLMRVLVGICGLHVDMTTPDENNEIELIIEGETTGEDVALAARTLFPGMSEFLDTAPGWRDGVEGLMQLITLSHINQALSKRLI